MQRTPRVAIVALFLAAVSSWTGCRDASTQPVDAATGTALRVITAEGLAQHVRFLAADALQGRGTGTDGYDRAAQYVAERFAEFGLSPAGDAAGFFQQVPLVRADLSADQTAIRLRSGGVARALTAGVDILVGPDFARERAGLTAPLAFVGYGVTAAEADYDDYAGVDVGGKVVVWLRGAPAALPNNQRAYHASPWVKRQAAVDRGAVGYLEVLTPEEAQRIPWERRVAQAAGGAMRWLAPGGNAQDAYEALFIQATLNDSGAAALFDGATTSLNQVFAAAEASRPQAFDLPGEIEVSTATRHSSARSANVLARLEGSDPRLAGEQIVLSAHLDHLGVGAAVDGDAIYNGAYDNASGVAVLLEVARALAALPVAPRRSVLFAAVTGEERGLLGSDYLARDVDATLGTVVANLNLDMVMMQGTLSEVVGFGIEHSTIADAARLGVAQSGLTLVPDPFPGQVVFIRSDQYSFVRRGVPALMLAPAPGPEFGDWISRVYHSPADDLSQAMDFQAGADFARLTLLVASHVANAPEPPSWNPDDFFGGKFGR